MAVGRGEDVSFKAFLTDIHSNICRRLGIRKKSEPMTKLILELGLVFLPLALLYAVGMFVPVIMVTLMAARIFYWLWRDTIARKRVLSGGFGND